jgi:AcrR family transcriptional regulator
MLRAKVYYYGVRYYQGRHSEFPHRVYMPSTKQAKIAAPDDNRTTAQKRFSQLTTKGERTRAAILDAAERQFSERGYDSVSLRQIIDEARVQMGQLQYYFPSKESVFVSAIERRIDGVIEGYSAALADLSRHAEAGTVDLRMVIRAVMAISRSWLSSDDTGKHRYLRMLGLSTMSYDQPDYVARHTRAFKPLNDVIAQWFGRLYPDVTDDRSMQAYYLVEANLLSLYVNIDSMIARSGRERTSAAVVGLYDDLEDFLVGGVERLLCTT